MIVEVGLLLAGAETAISTIKRAIAVGKDAHSLLGEFGKVFDSQDALVRAANEDRAKVRAANEEERSAMAEALDTVAAARRVQQMVEELKHFVVWELQDPGLWDAIMLERNAIIQRRKALELAAKRAKEKRRKELVRIAQVGGGGLVGVVLACALVYGAVKALAYFYMKGN